MIDFVIAVIAFVLMAVALIGGMEGWMVVMSLVCYVVLLAIIVKRIVNILVN